MTKVDEIKKLSKIYDKYDYFIVDLWGVVHNGIRIFDGIIEDRKQAYRFEQIETEGNDPLQSGEAVGTPSDLTSSDDEGGDSAAGSMWGEAGGSNEGGQPGAGRPKEPNKYGKDSGVRGRDPLGAHDKKKGGSGAPKYGKPLALAHYDSLKKSMNFNKKDREIITEMSELEEEYKNEVTSLGNDNSND